MVTVVAAETSVTTFKNVDASTYRTYNLLAPALLFEYLLALGIGVKIISEGEKRIEFGKVYHCVSLFGYISITK